ncbi:MAG TPA: hypothetical protein VFC78_00085 [Tepidisphaeraceae bacterium]|nr:hypothetical protein [Tepidisphaeraceae bacterium]
MHLDHEINRFVVRWWQKYESENPTEVFDKFFAIWLILVALARADENENTGKRVDSDTALVESFFRRNSQKIAEALHTDQARLKSLAGRRGDGHGNTTIDAPTKYRDRIRALSQSVIAGSTLNSRDISTLGCVFSLIRNNLFHGRKIYDSARDKELLAIVTPLIAHVVSIFWQPSR